MRTILTRYDARVVSLMRRKGIVFLRYSLAVIFVWFGALKPLGLSPAAGLVIDTVSWMPLFSPDTWLGIIGYWEILIGLCFLSSRTIRIAIALLAMQMVGTFMPLVILPEVTFQPRGVPFVLTMEGQYIIKNLVIIAAAIAIGGSVREANTAK